VEVLRKIKENVFGVKPIAGEVKKVFKSSILKKGDGIFNNKA
jgi:hypothetical protein